MSRIVSLVSAARDDTVRRAASVDGVESYACFSACERYRYVLVRTWDCEGPRIAFCGLNPATADEKKNDPTVARCVAFARRWGYGSLLMLNLFAFRSTQPKVLMAQAEPIGILNDRFLRRYSAAAAITVACWGGHGAHQGRAEQALPLLRRLHHLGLAQAGLPKRPLCLEDDLRPQPWAPAKDATAS